MKLIPYIFRNIRRNKLRTLLTVMAISICLMLTTFLYGYLGSMEAWGKEADKHNRVVTMSTQGFAGKVPIRILNDIRGTEGVAAAVPFSWYGGKYGDGTQFFGQFGTDPQHFFEVWNEYKLPANQIEDFKKDRQACVIDRALAKMLDKKVGDRIPLQATIYQFNLDLHLVGIVETPEDVKTLYFNLDYLDEGLRKEKETESRAGNCGTIFFLPKPGTSIPDLSKKIDSKYASSETPMITQTEKEFSQRFVKMQGNVQNFILFIAVFITVSLTLVAANGMAMSMRERTTEIAVLKAIGFQNGKVLFLMLGEAVLIACIGGFIGVAAGRGLYALGHMAAPIFIQTSKMAPSVMIYGILISAGIGLASGIIPALLAARLSVVDGLRRIV